MNNEIEAICDKQEATTRKTAACAVALGVEIVRELVGKSISGVPDINDNEMMSACIVSELKL